MNDDRTNVAFSQSKKQVEQVSGPGVVTTAYAYSIVNGLMRETVTRGAAPDLERGKGSLLEIRSWQRGKGFGRLDGWHAKRALNLKGRFTSFLMRRPAGADF